MWLKTWDTPGQVWPFLISHVSRLYVSQIREQRKNVQVGGKGFSSGPRFFGEEGNGLSGSLSRYLHQWIFWEKVLSSLWCLELPRDNLDLVSARAGHFTPLNPVVTEGIWSQLRGKYLREDTQWSLVMQENPKMQAPIRSPLGYKCTIFHSVHIVQATATMPVLWTSEFQCGNKSIVIIGRIYPHDMAIRLKHQRSDPQEARHKFSDLWH